MHPPQVLAVHQPQRLKDTPPTQERALYFLIIRISSLCRCSPGTQGSNRAAKVVLILVAGLCCVLEEGPESGETPGGNAREAWAEATMSLATGVFPRQEDWNDNQASTPPWHHS